MSPIKPPPDDGLFAREAAEGERLAERLLELAARVGRVIEALPDTKLARHIAAQLVRAATMPGACYEDVRAVENRADFVHRVAICQKELRETRYWLRLIARAELMGEGRVAGLIDECGQILAVLQQAVQVAKDRAVKGKPLK